jgi:hypothetical protein
MTGLKVVKGEEAAIRIRKPEKEKKSYANRCFFPPQYQNGLSFRMNPARAG